ncbi:MULTISPECIES: type II toxin-antitoxin system VapC family toxin [Sphingomonas]|uniref:type II toxin-antitoxin system VapC family toxin n=1 Tax=Sphingomonas TaxID=13687 RepID=UPI00193C259D|nr:MULTISPECIES: type II toxin-antitoxin system VapC family toxin [Sphingomonas]
MSDGYLLDTHTLIWWWNDPDRLSSTLIDVLGDPANPVFVSAISGLEIAIKVRIGQLPAMAARIEDFDAAIRRDGFVHLPVMHAHAVRGGLMPGSHRDPFDRILAAQALTDDLTVVTRDAEIAAFGCKVVW